MTTPRTYSFLDIQANITGPGISIPLGSGANIDGEGISVEFVDNLNTMTIGADGEGMHSLHGSKAARITVRVLKTSPTNGALALGYNFQRVSSTLHGKNVINISDMAGGDKYVAQQCAYGKIPSNEWKVDPKYIEWNFDCIKCDFQLGVAGG